MSTMNRTLTSTLSVAAVTPELKFIVDKFFNVCLPAVLAHRKGSGKYKFFSDDHERARLSIFKNQKSC